MDVESDLRDCRLMATPSIQVQFGKRVRALREARGHSQEAFAALANIDRGAFGKLERGEINAGLISLARIAVALEIGLPELLQTVEIDPDAIKAIPRSARGPKPIGARDREFMQR
ncbi:helix-turn-helix domain-containing protein [Rhizorhabdus sp. FW153]|uniref:helix-turn-helix domain-containing protein n=1 Tax=Rhizorhabdus sp. FW153 TaxID=3400216 RepID=UPI003CF50737